MAPMDLSPGASPQGTEVATENGGLSVLNFPWPHGPPRQLQEYSREEARMGPPMAPLWGSFLVSFTRKFTNSLG